MRTSRNQFLLDEEDVPTHWYNILADLDVPSSDVRRARPAANRRPAPRRLRPTSRCPCTGPASAPNGM